MHDARLQYIYANKLAKKYVKKATSEGKDPYVTALDDIKDSNVLDGYWISIRLNI